MNVIRIILALGLSFLAGQLARGEDDSPDELIRRIAELSQQGKYKEAIPPAEKLLAITKQARGPDDAETAACIGLLARLYESTGE